MVRACVRGGAHHVEPFLPLAAPGSISSVTAPAERSFAPPVAGHGLPYFPRLTNGEGRETFIDSPNAMWELS